MDDDFNPVAALIVSLLGFLIVGIYGVIYDNGFFPDCWWGLLAGLGILMMPDHHDHD